MQRILTSFVLALMSMSWAFSAAPKDEDIERSRASMWRMSVNLETPNVWRGALSPLLSFRIVAGLVAEIQRERLFRGPVGPRFWDRAIEYVLPPGNQREASLLVHTSASENRHKYRGLTY